MHQAGPDRTTRSGDRAATALWPRAKFSLFRALAGLATSLPVGSWTRVEALKADLEAVEGETNDLFAK